VSRLNGPSDWPSVDHYLRSALRSLARLLVPWGSYCSPGAAGVRKARTRPLVCPAARCDSGAMRANYYCQSASGEAGVTRYGDYGQPPPPGSYRGVRFECAYVLSDMSEMGGAGIP
jgi:hypothetical protein